MGVGFGDVALGLGGCSGPLAPVFDGVLALGDVGTLVEVLPVLADVRAAGLRTWAALDRESLDEPPPQPAAQTAAQATASAAEILILGLCADKPPRNIPADLARVNLTAGVPPWLQGAAASGNPTASPARERATATDSART